MKRLTYSFKINHFYWFLGIIVLVNIITKFLFLSQESIYTDEPYSIFYAQQSLQTIYNQCLQDSNPPLYLFILHFWIKLFGISSVAVKSLSILASVGTAILIAYFAKKHLNPISIIIASLFFLFSNIQFYYSHEVRTYAVLSLFVITSMFLFYEILIKPKISKLIILSIINVSILFLHYSVIYMHAVQIIFALFFYKSNIKGFYYYCISQIISILFFFPWIKIVLSNTPTGKGWLHSPHLGDLLDVFVKFSNHKISFIIIHLFIAIYFILLIRYKKKYITDTFDFKLFLLFLLWYCIPIIGNYIVSQVFPMFIIRTLLFSSLGLYLLIAYMVSTINLKKQTILFIIVTLLLPYIIFYKIKQHGPENWNTMVPTVTKLQGNKTMIIVTPWWNFMAFSYYYNQSFFKKTEQTNKLLNEEKIFCLNEKKELNTSLDLFDTVIVMKSRPIIDNLDSMLYVNGFKKSKIHNYKDLNTSIFIRE